MKWSFEKIMKHIDWWIAIPVGLLALILSMYGDDCVCLTWVAGFLCLIYIIYVVYLIIDSPKFDWHLLHGHYLRKVVAFVLLTPSFIASLYLLFSPNYSHKNLVFDDDLYT